MKNNILLIVFLIASSFSYSQVSSAKKLPESTEIKEETSEKIMKEEITNEPTVNSVALPSSREIPIQISTEQPLVEPKNSVPAMSSKKKL